MSLHNDDLSIIQAVHRVVCWSPLLRRHPRSTRERIALWKAPTAILFIFIAWEFERPNSTIATMLKERSQSASFYSLYTCAVASRFARFRPGAMWTIQLLKRIENPALCLVVSEHSVLCERPLNSVRFPDYKRAFLSRCSRYGWRQRIAHVIYANVA